MIRSRFLLVIPLVLGSLLLAACGSTSVSASSSAKTSTTTTSPATGGFSSYRSCLAAHGVTLPTRPAGSTGTFTPGSGGGGFGGGQVPAGVNAATFQKAQQACASLRPQRSASASAAYAAYRSCMQDHGVTLPQRGTGTSTSGAAQPSTTIDRTSPAFVAANTACAALMPQGFGGSNSSTTTPAA